MRKLIAQAVAALVLLTGCGSQPDLNPIQRALEPAVLAVPGVTGGTVGLGYASLSPNIVCKLTGSGATKDALKDTLDRVLKVVADHTRSLSSGMVQCTIVNGDLFANAGDLGFSGTLGVEELRQRYP